MATPNRPFTPEERALIARELAKDVQPYQREFAGWLMQDKRTIRRVRSADVFRSRALARRRIADLPRAARSEITLATVTAEPVRGMPVQVIVLDEYVPKRDRRGD